VGKYCYSLFRKNFNNKHLLFLVPSNFALNKILRFLTEVCITINLLIYRNHLMFFISKTNISTAIFFRHAVFLLPDINFCDENVLYDLLNKYTF